MKVSPCPGPSEDQISGWKDLSYSLLIMESLSRIYTTQVKLMFLPFFLSFSFIIIFYS